MVERCCTTVEAAKEAIYYFRNVRSTTNNYGIHNLTNILRPESDKMDHVIETFFRFLKRFLRRNYMIWMMRQGEMKQMKIYINIVNHHLLYL